MFAYLDHDSWLHSRNPLIKLAVLILITLTVCLSYDPTLPLIVLICSFTGIWIAGRISLFDLVKRLGVFIVISMIFVISMLFFRGLGDDPAAVLEIGIFQWNETDLTQVPALGLRILSLVTLSMGFVLTTNPGTLILSLIQQGGVPVLHGYSAMAAYRFLPELQEQVERIHLAQEIRGNPWNRGFFSRLSSPFRVMLPLLCTAVRRGENIACAMESRGLGVEKERSFLKTVKTDRTDWCFLIGAVVFCIGSISVMTSLGLYHFSIAGLN